MGIRNAERKYSEEPGDPINRIMGKVAHINSFVMEELGI